MLFALLFASAISVATPTGLVSPQTPLETLEAQIFNAQLSLQERWVAMMKLVEYPGAQAEVILEKAAASSDWVLKSGAMVALKQFNQGKALVWAHKLLNDRAMMVRISAINVIGDLKSKDSASLLWESLQNPVNFHNGDSLPSRKILSRVLFQLSEKKEEWVKLSQDKDLDVQKLAQTKLQQIF